MKIKKDTGLKVSEVLKRTVVTFLPLSLIAGIVIFSIYRDGVGDYMTSLQKDEKHSVDVMHEKIVDYFRPVISDLMLMSREYEIHVLNEDDEVAALELFSNELLILSANSKVYKTVRFIDETGMEVIRVNRKEGESRLVAEEELQSKSDRYYFKEIFKLRQGEVYASPFDLNIEHGKVEEPSVPIIRFGTPLFYRDGRKRGILVINYLGQDLINSLKEKYEEYYGEFMLVNDDGYWLKGVDPGDEWGFMYEERKEKRFGRVYPEEWQRISKSESGKINNAEGFFTFQTVYPLFEGLRAEGGLNRGSNAAGMQGKDRAYRWKLVSYIPRGVMAARTDLILNDAIRASIPVAMLLVLFSLFMARAGLHRKRAEEVLRESEEKYRDLFENANDLIQCVDSNGRFLYVNSTWRRKLGYSDDDLEKLTVFDIIADEDMEHCMELFKEIMSGVKTDSFETAFVAKDGRKVLVEGNVNCHFEKGEPVDTRGIFRDISERRLAEDKLENTYRELLEKSERLERFNQLTVGRELEMIRLKGEVDDLLEQLGEPGRYRDLKELQNIH
jgi:PAS domain S-box-containing protein